MKEEDDAMGNAGQGVKGKNSSGCFQFDSIEIIVNFKKIYLIVEKNNGGSE
jgi:hypothetical protein